MKNVRRKSEKTSKVRRREQESGQGRWEIFRQRTWGQETEWNGKNNPEPGTQKVELRIQNLGLTCRTWNTEWET